LRVAELDIDRAAMSRRLAAALREAGALALLKFRAPMKSWLKSGHSPVSEVDIAIDELLRERFMADALGFGWLSEESADDPARLNARRVWIVDPIDGTRGFLAGHSDWVIAAALVEDGRPLVAALYAPVDDVLFLAVTGEGTTVNGSAVRPCDGDGLDGVRVAGPKRSLAAVAAVATRVEALPKVHSLALRLAKVADGSLDVAFAGANSHDWDVAAADLIVHEAGGRLTTFGGERLTYNRRNPVHGALVAAGRVRHGLLLRLMRERPTAFA
jgi:myo-inositol-1(or 4)-monophosphatase